MNIKGSGSSAMNSFSGGMVSDTDALFSKNNTYYYAENARISQPGSIGTLSNIEEFTSKIELPLDAGVFLAYFKTDGFTVLISKDNDKLNVFKYLIVDGEEQCVKIATIIDSVDPNRISNINHLSITASIESEKIQRLYIADGIHGIYSINMYSSSAKSDDVVLDLYRDGIKLGRYFGIYQQSVDYITGDIVLYNNKLYSADIDNPQSTPANNSDWSELNPSSIESLLYSIQSGSTNVPLTLLNFYEFGISSYRYFGNYNPNVSYRYTDTVKYNNAFYMCNNVRGSISLPTDTGYWEFLHSDDYKRYRVDPGLYVSDRYVFERTGIYSVYKGEWSGSNAYSTADVVLYDGSFYSANIDIPEGALNIDSNWSFICLESDTHDIITASYTGSVYSDTLIKQFPYRGEWDTYNPYFKDDCVLHNGKYFAVNSNFMGQGEPSELSQYYTYIGDSSEIGYYETTDYELVTNYSLYRYNTSEGPYLGNAFDLIGYYSGDIIKSNGIFYRAKVDRPVENVSVTSDWEAILSETDLLYSIKQVDVNNNVVDGVKTYDVAKIEYGSILYDKPTVEVSTSPGGSLSIGKYFYVIRYTTDSGAESGEVYVSDGINATKSNTFGGIIDDETGYPSQSNTSINILVKDVDSDAYGLNVYRVYYNASGANSKISLIYSDKITRINGVSTPINIVDSSDSDILNSVEDSILFNQNIRTVSVIENKDNLLFSGNININPNSTIDYDTRAFAFDRNGSFKYRNSSDPLWINNNEIRFAYLNDDDSIYGLSGKEKHDFINDSIYLSNRYRDIEYRYKFSDNNLNGMVFGGAGKNISYEFVHTYLIAAKPQSIFKNKLSDNNWFYADKFDDEETDYGLVNINSPDSEIKELSCKSLIDLNSSRDDLVIKIGDDDRYIDKISIRNQQKTINDNPLDVIDISSFGVMPHNGKFDYSNAVLANIFSGFKRNEIFRFAVKFKLKNGSCTDPMWISDIRFPANYMTGRVEYNGSNNTAPDIFSFSSFVAPEDIEEGIDIINEAINNATNVIHNGFDSLEYEDKLGIDGLSKSELLIKPLGIKFEFKNVPENVESAKILFEELSTIERTILGQFLVSRIGMFSNSGVPQTATNKYYESASDGFGYPHPTPSMKYTYGIMPTRSTFLQNDSNKFIFNTLGFSIGLANTQSFDSYSSVANPFVGSDISSNIWGLIDKRLSRTSAISTSPYFSDISNYMLISPEVSYIGEAFNDIVSNIGKDIVFENLIYSKNVKPFINTSTSLNNLFRTIGVIGRSANTAVRSNINGEGIFSRPFNETINIKDGYKQQDTTNYLSFNNSKMFSYIPTSMYTGSMLSESDRVDCSIDTMGYFPSLSLCGPSMFSILEASLWYGKKSTGNNRLGDSIFKIYGNRYVRMSATKFTEGVSGIDTENVSILSNVNTPDIYSLVSESYQPGNTLSITDKKKAFEKMWDEDSDGKIATNYPISIKTFMSGVGYVLDLIDNRNMSNSGFKYNASYASGMINTNPTTTDNGKYDDFTIKYRLDSDSTRFNKLGPANSVALKYYKSIIPSRNYFNRNESDFGINEYDDSYISFFKQNTKEFDGYDYYLSNKDGIKLRDYIASNDEVISKGFNSVWDFDSIAINNSIYAGILQSPTGPFDLSGSIALSGYSGFINYSKSLSSDVFGVKSVTTGGSSLKNSSTSLFSSVIDKDSETLFETKEFISLNASRRGRISGKHGAGILVSLNSSIPMVGHIMSNDYKLDKMLSVSMSRFIEKMNEYKNSNTALYKEYRDQLQRTRLYWHMLDGACSSHTSTYLVDIRSKANKLFSTASYTSKRNSRYIETAQSINFGDSSNHKYYVFGGGTYVTMFDYTSTYGNKPEPHNSYTGDPEAFDNWNSVADACNTARINIIVPIESTINTHVDSGCNYRKTNNPWSIETPTQGVNSPNSGYSSSVVTIIQDSDEYMYADAFSAKKDFNAIENNYSKDDVYNTYSYKSRVMSSEKKIMGEQNDSWSIFKPNNYIDLNPSNGSINALVTFGSRLYAFQDSAVSVLSVNERSLITDGTDSGSQLLLGTGKILDYSAIVSDVYGLQKENINSISKCIRGVYFFDSNNASICRLSSSLDNLSNITMTGMISNNISASNMSFIFPWIKNTEILFRFDSIDYSDNVNKSLLFDESSTKFESFITTNFDFGFEFGSDIRLIVNGDNDTNPVILSPTDRQISDMSVYFNVNDAPQNTKIFDSIDVNISSNHASSIDDKIEIFSSYSNSIANTGLFKSMTSDSLSIQNKNSNIHYSIPRVDGEITRMRDKYIKSMYKFVGGSEISLPYIKTNYRYSVV